LGLGRERESALEEGEIVRVLFPSADSKFNMRALIDCECASIFSFSSPPPSLFSAMCIGREGGRQGGREAGREGGREGGRKVYAPDAVKTGRYIQSPKSGFFTV
jgi:hypothetical protein